MRRMLALSLIVALSGCINMPVKEATQVKGNADREVMKIYLEAVHEKNAKFDKAESKIKRDFDTAWGRALNLEPKGFIPGKIAKKLIATKNLGLMKLAEARLSEISNLEQLSKNYLASSKSQYDAWELQGKLTAEMVQEARAMGFQYLQIYQSVQEAKKRKRDAEKEMEKEAEHPE